MNDQELDALLANPDWTSMHYRGKLAAAIRALRQERDELKASVDHLFGVGTALAQREQAAYEMHAMATETWQKERDRLAAQVAMLREFAIDAQACIRSGKDLTPGRFSDVLAATAPAEDANG